MCRQFEHCSDWPSYCSANVGCQSLYSGGQPISLPDGQWAKICPGMHGSVRGLSAGPPSLHPATGWLKNSECAGDLSIPQVGRPIAVTMLDASLCNVVGSPISPPDGQWAAQSAHHMSSELLPDQTASLCNVLGSPICVSDGQWAERYPGMHGSVNSRPEPKQAREAANRAAEEAILRAKQALSARVSFFTVLIPDMQCNDFHVGDEDRLALHSPFFCTDHHVTVIQLSDDVEHIILHKTKFFISQFLVQADRRILTPSPLALDRAGTAEAGVNADVAMPVVRVPRPKVPMLNLSTESLRMSVDAITPPCSFPVRAQVRKTCLPALQGSLCKACGYRPEIVNGDLHIPLEAVTPPCRFPTIAQGR